MFFSRANEQIVRGRCPSLFSARLASAAVGDRIRSMCGRYQRRSDKQRIAEAFALGHVDGLALGIPPDYNLAPQTMQPVIVWDQQFETRTLHMMFWRFLPRYVTDPKQL